MCVAMPKRQMDESLDHPLSIYFPNEIAKLVERYCIQACIIWIGNDEWKFKDIYNLNLVLANKQSIREQVRSKYSLHDKSVIYSDTCFLVKLNPNLTICCQDCYSTVYVSFFYKDNESPQPIPNLETPNQSVRWLQAGFTPTHLISATYSDEESAISIWQFDVVEKVWQERTPKLRDCIFLDSHLLLHGTEKWTVVFLENVLYVYDHTQCLWKEIKVSRPHKSKECNSWCRRFECMLIVNDDVFLFERRIQNNLIWPFVIDLRTERVTIESQRSEHCQCKSCHTFSVNGVMLCDN